MTRTCLSGARRARRLVLFVLPLYAAAAVFAAEPSAGAPARVTTIDLAAEASRNAPNDLARATAYFESQDASPGELARRVNRTIAAGLETAKAHPAVKVKSGNTSTWPVYGKTGRSIDAWRMRSEILLETRDTAALSELLGKLQATMAIGQIVLQPSPETRKKIEDDTTLDAIAAFQARATLIAKSMNKSHRIRQMSINTSGGRPIYPMARQAPMSMSADAAPMPMESGESTVTISVTGQIELSLE